MDFNLTGIDKGAYFIVSSVANIALFGISVLPPLLLCLLCVLALATTSGINLKIKVLLVNIFAAEICNWLGYTVYYLGFPARIVRLPGDYSCANFISLVSVATVQKYSASTLYAINVFIFIKYGEKKMKWYAIILFIAISWILAILYNILPYFRVFQIFNINGFCSSNPESDLIRVVVPAVVSLPAICMIIITVTFCILIFLYIKKNALEDNVEVKKAVAKVLLYLAIFSVLSFVCNVIPPVINPRIRGALGDRNVISLIVINYVLRTIFSLPNFPFLL